jgi:uncharacterized membrane protein YcaP (DUF421 family)
MPPQLDILLRPVWLFLLVFILVRLGGKKHPAKASPFLFVNYAVIAVVAALMAMGVVADLRPGLVALAVFGLLPVLLDHLALRSKAVYDLLHGKSTVLVKQGKIMEENLRQVRLSGEDLLADLRLKNAFALSDVEFAVLEPTGDLNVLLKSDKLPVTPYDVEWKVTPRTEPQTVILDGNILHEPLTEAGLNRNWLHTQLAGMGVALDNVFVGQVDSNGELYVDLFDDAVQLPKSNVRELLWAGLEKSVADLEKFSLETEDGGARSMFAGNAASLREMMDRLRPYILR